MKALTMTAGAVIACMIAGCASKPPTELRNARAAYNDAAQSQGANLAQSDVYEAKKSLDRAELSFNDDGDAPETRDLAYVAERKALIAKAKGNTMVSMQQKQIAMQDAQRWREQQATAMRQQLGQTKTQLEASQQQLESERQARVAADQRTADAISRIKGLTARRTERGLELTISGSVLFTTGKSELMPGARKRLDDVITALKDTQRSLTIVGHTDSVGSDEKNMELSRKRAEAVRTYMTTHGFPEDRITAEGMGETQPVADNKSAEGRANNRRVEIIIQMPQGEQQQQPGMGGQQPGQQPGTSGGTSSTQSGEPTSTTTTTGGTIQAPSGEKQTQPQTAPTSHGNVRPATPDKNMQHMQQQQPSQPQQKP
jgi:outer membrane protein OmpA-like peptidoglycan-associated protein